MLPRWVTLPGDPATAAPPLAGADGRPRQRARGLLRVALSATMGPLAILTGGLLVFVVLPVPAAVRVALGHVLLTALPLAAAVNFTRAARRASGGAATSLALLGIACLLTVVAQAIWAVRQVFFGLPEPFPSLSFYIFLSFHPLVWAGVILALRRDRARPFALEMTLDAVLFFVAVAGVLLRIVIERLMAVAPWLTTTELTWILIGQVLSVGTVFFAGLLIIWRDRVLPSGVVGYLAAGLALNATTTLFLARQLDPDPNRPGHAFTLLWATVWLLILRAAARGYRAATPRPAPPESTGRVATLMRHAVVATGVLVLGGVATGLLGPGQRHALAAPGPAPALPTRITLALLALAVVARASVALHASEREAEERRALRETRALVDVSNALAAAADLEPALTLVADWARRLLHGEGAAVELLQPEGNATVAAAVGSLQPARGSAHEYGRSVLAWLTASGRAGARATGHAAAAPALTALGVEPTRPAAAAPLRFGERLSGSLLVALPERLPDKRELELLGALAEQAALAVESQRIVEEARRSERQRAQAEKLSTVGQLAGGIAHEINNPLAAIQSAAELLLDEHPGGEGTRLLTLIHSEARRAGGIVRNLLELVRPQEARAELVDVTEALEDTLRLRNYAHGLEDVTVVRRLEPIRPIRGDRDRLRQVFLNLVVNAEQALVEQAIRRIEVDARMRDDLVEVTIADNGSGIAPEHLERIFDPFFTTKPVGQGTGLGLSVTHGIVRDLGGSLTAHNHRLGGAVFTLRLPAAAEDVSACAPVTAPASAPRGRERAGCVLLVDDEPAIREVAARSLRRFGFEVEVAPSGEEAIELLQRQRFDVILSDIRMPGLGGEGLYRRLQALRIPAVDRFIFISGDIVAEATQRFLAETGRPYLIKPFELTELVAKVRQVAEGQGAGV